MERWVFSMYNLEAYAAAPLVAEAIALSIPFIWI